LKIFYRPLKGKKGPKAVEKWGTQREKFCIDPTDEQKNKNSHKKVCQEAMLLPKDFLKFGKADI
jgi:hypothetical protein